MSLQIALLDVSLRCGLSIRRHRPDGLFWRVAAKNESCFARRARVHVDFHPDGYFNDFRSVPGHVFLFQVGGVDTCVFPPLHVLCGGRI